MRNVGRFRSMIRVYTIAEQMDRMCKDIVANTTSEDDFLRDEIQGIVTRLQHIMYHSNSYARDEYDFGTQGYLFEYTLKNNLKKALEEMGLIPDLNNKNEGETE